MRVWGHVGRVRARRDQVRVLGSYEQSYRILDVVAGSGGTTPQRSRRAAALKRRTTSRLDISWFRCNDQDLHTSELLPLPIGDEAPGLVGEDGPADFVRDLAKLSVPDADRSRFRASWGPEIGDLFRYDRVEGPSVGVRAEWTTATGIGAVGLEASGWLGIGS